MDPTKLLDTSKIHIPTLQDVKEASAWKYKDLEDDPLGGVPEEESTPVYKPAPAPAPELSPADAASPKQQWGRLVATASTSSSPDEAEQRHQLEQFDNAWQNMPVTERQDVVNADVTDKGWQRTALHIASSTGNLAVVRWLIHTAHADVESRNKSGETPLYEACRTGRVDVVRALVEEGHADIEATTLRGWRPLHEAVDESRQDVVLYLLSRGADTTAKTTRELLGHPAGSSPLDIAAKRGHVDIMALLESPAALSPVALEPSGAAMAFSAVEDLAAADKVAASTGLATNATVAPTLQPSVGRSGAQRSPVPSGRQIIVPGAKYPVVRFVGHGRFGPIYKAKFPFDSIKEQAVALKVLSIKAPSYRSLGDALAAAGSSDTKTAADTMTAESQLRENQNAVYRCLSRIEQLASMDHPSLARIHDAYIAAYDPAVAPTASSLVKELHLVTDFCAGGPVGNLLQDVPTTEILTEIFRQVLAGLAVLHSRDPPVPHFAISPDTVCLRNKVTLSRCRPWEVCVKLVDFGLTDEAMTAVARSRSDYSDFWSPERMSSDFGIEDDIWSAGLTLLCLGLGITGGAQLKEQIAPFHPWLGGTDARSHMIGLLASFEQAHGPKLAHIVRSMLIHDRHERITAAAAYRLLRV